mgnify:FL=1
MKITKIGIKILDLLKRKLTNPIEYSRKIGVKIGENCKLNGVPNWGSEPYLIELGNRTEISFEVAFVTHDGATWVFRNQDKYKEVIKFGKIKIGNDSFVGARSTILPGVEIGDFCIVAAGSVVTKDIPSGEVWGGVPAHYIMKTERYAKKCLEETPIYDKREFERNKKKELMRIL